MAAFERGYPGLTVFLTYGYSEPLSESVGYRKPVIDTRYALLVPFLDGMFGAASDSVVIVDGHEASYPYRDPATFAAKADTMRHAVRRLVAQPERYSRQVSVSFGIWLDFNSDHVVWHTDHPESNYFTPAALAVSVQAALDHADRYVWIYSQQPRWWTAEGGPQKLPAAYDSVLRAVSR
jgi:2-polyprenyl-6-methoxyphenol hydroxylase-like FAD-dependent oxidoreductase